MVGGRSIYFAEAGRGSAVVLLHGFPLDSRVWEGQMSGLAGEFRVIAPDLPGFGQSGPPSPFSIESLADDVHALLRQVDALPCILGGLSMGGYAAQAFINKYPNDVAGLMLIDTKSEGDTAQAKQGRARMIELVRAGGSAAVAGQMMPNMMTNSGSRPEIASRLMGMMRECPPLTIEYALLALRDREDYRECLASIPVPTLIVVGRGDAIAPVSIAEQMAAQIPRATLAIIPDAGHMAPIERPELVNQAMLKYCRERASQARR
jgi:pimeloyl-ACP methyl ester carboxylesterase